MKIETSKIDNFQISIPKNEKELIHKKLLVLQEILGFTPKPTEDENNLTIHLLISKEQKTRIDEKFKAFDCKRSRTKSLFSRLFRQK